MAFNKEIEMNEQEINRFCTELAKKCLEDKKEELMDFYLKGLEHNNERGFIYCFIDEKDFKNLEQDNIILSYEYVTKRHPLALIDLDAKLILSQLQSYPNLFYTVFNFGIRQIVMVSEIN